MHRGAVKRFTQVTSSVGNNIIIIIIIIIFTIITIIFQNSKVFQFRVTQTTRYCNNNTLQTPRIDCCNEIYDRWRRCRDSCLIDELKKSKIITTIIIIMITVLTVREKNA